MFPPCYSHRPSVEEKVYMIHITINTSLFSALSTLSHFYTESDFVKIPQIPAFSHKSQKTLPGSNHFYLTVTLFNFINVFILL